ncbi:hypothetical protein BKA62DRAFT_367994 [Auriculariales sp. MPI-PUGE-AT-0066]|nr:hypothetical protein BKA62DRAFT_367994 [Auriculariales sp. MPI-PUGE-AT-0066]
MPGLVSNARLYRDVLKHRAEGICVWWPSIDGAVGDCGHMKDGRWVTLFNVFDPPDGFPSLPRPTSRREFRSETYNNTDIIHAVTNSQCSFEASTPDAITNFVNLNISLAGANSAAAFLVPGGLERQVDTYFEENHFIDYLDQNYRAITREFSGHDLSTIMILRSVTSVRGWCRGLAKSNGRAVSASIAITLLGVPTFSIGASRNTVDYQSWAIQAGPSGSTVPAEQNTVIVVPVVLRIRQRIKHSLNSLISVSSGSRFNERNLSGKSLMSSSIPSTSQEIAQSGAGDVVNSTEIVNVDREEMSATDSTDSDEDADGYTVYEDLDPQDKLETLLDAVLEARPDLNAVAFSWNTSLIESIYCELDETPNALNVLQKLPIHIQPVGASGSS